MYRLVRTPTIPAGFSFLLLISMATPAAASLREEAAGYRTQGYEAQRRGDNAEALSNYQKATALDPTYPTPHNDLGVLYEEMGRLEEAEREYQEALTLSANYLEPHANLAMLYERTGQREKAIFHWMKRYQLGDAHDPWTARAEERLLSLGVLKSHPGLKGVIYSRRRAVDDELNAHDKSREEFRAITETHGDWP
jgi:tetratricopeptide (TPR) repeat protein